MHDRADLEEFHRGDSAYFAELVARFSPRLLFIARSFTSDPDHAHDLVQTTWMRVYEKRRDYSGSGALVGWIGSVCRHVCLNDRRARDSRKKLLQSFHDEGAGPGRSVDPLAATDHEARMQQIHRALAELTDREREMFALTYGEGLTCAEVGERLKTTQSTVRVHLTNCRKKIRSHLGIP